jgi:hypothetical protein
MKRIGYITVRITPFFVVIFTAILIFGCSLFNRDFTLPDPPAGGKGILVLTFNSSLWGSKTLEPDISMVPAFYDIAGVGPDSVNDHFEKQVDLNGPNAGDPLIFDALTPGEWTITVDARNATGTIIGHGETSEPVQVGPGDPTIVEIDILPLSGTGGLELTVEWTKNTHTGAVVSCSLTSMSTGVELDLALDFDLIPKDKPFKAQYSNIKSNTAIEAGYYLLILQLYDGGVLFWGIAEAVRIVADQTTTASWTAAN